MIQSDKKDGRLPPKFYIDITSEMAEKGYNLYDGDISVVFAKLYEHSHKIHRIDILNENIRDLGEALSQISAYSMEKNFPGTPVPPQYCDQKASKINTKKNYYASFLYNNLKFIIPKEYGKFVDFRTNKYINPKHHDEYDIINRSSE